MSSIERKQGFTIATATATLPLVSRIVDELVALSQEISDTQRDWHSRLVTAIIGPMSTQTSYFRSELRLIKSRYALRVALTNC